MEAINRRLLRVGLGFGLAAALILGGCGGAQKSGAQPVEGRSYAFWPPFPNDPHVQFVRALNNSGDVDPRSASGLERMVFGKEVDAPAGINKPYGVAMRNGRVYVADLRNSCVVVFDLRSKQMRLIGTSGSHQLKRPVAIALADDSSLYVADVVAGAVLVFDAKERYAASIGYPNFKPAALAVHADRLYATDMTGQCVAVFDRRSGKALGRIGNGVGDGDGQFRLPLGVATDKDGNVYVMDMMRCKLQKFTPEGEFLGAVGAIGRVAGMFARPKHIAVDSEGIIYAVDASFQNVQMFNDRLELLMHFGAAGDFKGAMDLPAGICVNEDSLDLFADQLHPGFKAKRLIVVTNQFGGNLVSIYAMGDLREGYTAQDLARAAAPVTAGTGVPTDEDIKMAAPGSEPPSDPMPGVPSEDISPGSAPPAITPAQPAPKSPGRI